MAKHLENPMNYEDWSKSIELEQTSTPNLFSMWRMGLMRHMGLIGVMIEVSTGFCRERFTGLGNLFATSSSRVSCGTILRSMPERIFRNPVNESQSMKLANLANFRFT